MNDDTDGCGEPTDEQMLRNLYKLMTTCWKCDRPVGWNQPVCETCGNELLEHGKQ